MARSPHLRVPEGHVLYHPGEVCAGFVVIHAGTVRVSLTAGNGREIVLYRVRPGEICLQTFGCLINGTRYAAEGVAETALEIEVIPTAEFHARIAGDPAFRGAVFGAVAARFAELEQLVEDVALSSVEERLARALLRLAGARGTVALTHEALAVEIGSAREVVSRQLGAWARAGVVTLERGHIAIAKRDALQALAGPEHFVAAR